MAVAKPLHLRLFIEGEEVPVISAQISINVNSPAAAAIQVIPLDEVMNLFPRTMVHLFWLDNRVTDVKTQTNGATAGQSIDVRGQYRLLFSGEFIAFSSVQTPQSRGLVMQCVDFSNYWDSAHATAIEYGLGGNAFTNTGSLYGGAVGTFDDIVNQQANQLLAWINQKPQTPGLQTVSGLAGGIIRIMEAMGGVPGHSKGINDFFTVAELRCRLLSQITAEENDNTAARFFGAKVFDEWLRNGLQNIGQQVTFRDMMKLLFQYIYYEFIPNPAAKFDEAVKNQSTTVPGSPINFGSSPIVLKIIQDMEKHIAEFNNAIVGAFAISSAIQNIAASALKDCKAAVASLQKLKAQQPSFAKGIVVANNDLTAAISSISKAAAPGTHEVTELAQGQKLMEKVVDDINNLPDITARGSPTTVTNSVSQRLRAQIIRPDCWFSAAPRCNVIFPEQFTQLSYERNFLSETTRSLIQMFNTLVGKDALFADRILAPNIGFQTITKKANAGDYRVLMDHEIHTGIIPRTEWLPNTSAVGANATASDKALIKGARLSWADRVALWHFFKYRFASRQLSIAGRFNPFIVCGFPAVVIKTPYIIQGGITTIANLPSVSSSTPNTLSNDQILTIIDSKAQDLGAPTQIVAMVSGVTHNVDQSGGTTSVTMHHARAHLGVDDEFLSLYLTSLNGTTTRAVKTTVTFQQASAAGQDALMKILIAATPQGNAGKLPKTKTRKVSKTSLKSTSQQVDPTTGTISTVQSTTSHTVIQEGDAIPPGDPPPLTKRGRIDKVNRSNILVPAPAGKIAAGSKNGFYSKSKGVVLGVEVLDATINKTSNGQAFGAVAIYENVPIAVQGSIPIEEVIRPKWFSNSYSNLLIGKNIYNLFFGCGSIVDDLLTGALTSQPAVPGAQNDPDVSSFSADMSPQDVINALISDEQSKNSVSISKAVNAIGYLYGQVRSQSLDVDEFIRSYIDRPIATISQIFGSTDLELGIDQSSGLVTATQGSVGFFTGAVNPALANTGGLVGIAQDLSLNLKRINNVGASSPLVTKYDVRPANKARVVAYVSALSKGPGFRG